MNKYKQQKQKLITKLKSKECFDFVYRKLNDIQQLPSKGVVAGQAVSSAVTEFLELDINPAYNDIDIFHVIPYNFRSMNEPGYINTKATLGDLESYNGYRHLWKRSFSLRIHNTYTNNMINTTTYTSNSYNIRTNPIEYILSYFDINVVTIGFYLSGLKSNELYFKEDFLDYLLTRQLEISNYNVYNHSYIRLHKKFNELKNVYCNFEEEAKICSFYNHLDLLDQDIISGFMNYDYVWKFLKIVIGSNGNVQTFGEKYKELFHTYNTDKNISIYKSDMTSATELFYLDYNIDLHNTIEDIKTKLPLNKSIEASFDFILDPEKYVDCPSVLVDKISTFPILNFNQLYKYGRKINTPKKHYWISNINNILIPNENNNNTFIDPNILKHLYKYSLNDYQFIIKELNWLMKKHRLVYIKIVETSSRIYDTLQELKELKKKHGDLVYGIIETVHFKPNMFENLTDNIEKLILKGTEELKERELHVHTILGEIKELVTDIELRREGTEMKHCVGGYGNNVKSGNSIILSVKEYSGLRYTIEINQKSRKIIQIYSKSNYRINITQARLQHIFKPILTRYNSHLSLSSLFVNHTKYKPLLQNITTLSKLDSVFDLDYANEF